MMKKTIYATLLSVMLLASCIAAALPASAAADRTSNELAKHLVTYWNFEGDNLETALSDKAPFGESDDTLTVLGDLVKIEDGVAYIPHDAQNALYADDSVDLSGVTADTVEDTKVIETTIFFRVKIDGTGTGMPPYVYRKGLYRICGGAYVDGGTMADIGVRVREDARVGRAYSVMEYDVWKYVGVTMKINQTTLTSEMSIALFDDSDIDSFVSVFEINDKVAEAEMQKYVAALINGEKTVLGKPADYVDLGENFWFDDVRIYNTAMTDGELAVIAKEIDKDYSNIDFDEPEDPTPSESDTTDEQEPPTPSDSDEEETTKQPETSGSDEPQESAGSDEPEQTTAPGGNGSGEGGCSSMLAAPAGIVAVAIVAGCAVRKRRED